MDRGSRKIQYLVTLSVSLAFVAFGAISAWPSPVIPKFKRNETDVDIDDAGISWMVSIKPVGFIAGSFISRYTMDNLGRRPTIMYSALPVAVGSLIVFIGAKAWMLFVTMFLWNCGTGMISTVLGIYLAETSDKDIRATLLVCTRLSFNLGHLLLMSTGPLLSYKAINSIILPMPFIFFAACSWIPETPYYLLKKGNVVKARKELQRLYGYRDGKTLEDELKSIQSGVRNDMAKSSSAVELFTGRQYRRAIIVCTGIKFTQIFTGGVAIKDYIGVILEESKLPQNLEKIMFIIFGGVTFVITIISSIFVDRIGRRPLLVASYIGTSISLAAVGIYFFLLNETQIDYAQLSVFGFIPFLGIILSNIISTFGFIALSTVIPAELFPVNVKVIAMTSLSIFGAILGFTVGKGYQNVKDLLGSHTVFWIFGSVALFGAVFSYFVVPETRGKSLNEIQMELQGDAYQEVKTEDVCGTEMEILESEKPDTDQELDRPKV